MSNKQPILAQLDKLIKRAAASKTAAPGGDLKTDNGTAAPETGARMAENKSDAAKSTKAMVDGGSVVNPVNGSVANSTEGAAAVAVNGQTGATGGVLHNTGDAPNERGGSIKSASLSDQLRKAASELEAPAAPAPVVKVASDVESFLKGVLGKTAGARELSGLEKHVAAKVKSGAIKVAGDAGQMDEHGAADAGVKELVQKLESGQIPEEQAEQMLMQALQDGSLTKEDVLAAMKELHAPGAAGDPAAQPDASAGAPPAPADAGAPPADASADPASDPAMSQKIAMVDIGEDHPQYFNKLAILYSKEMQQAKLACIAFAEELIKSAAAPGGDVNVDNGTKKVEEAPGATKPTEAEGATAAKVEDNTAKTIPAAKTGGDAGAMPVAPPAPDAPAGAPAPAGADADPMAAAGVAPQGADQEAAIDAILQQMGISRDQLKALLSQPTPPPADPSMAKAAAYTHKVAGVIMAKLACLDLANPAAK